MMVHLFAIIPKCKEYSIYTIIYVYLFIIYVYLYIIYVYLFYLKWYIYFTLNNSYRDWYTVFVALFTWRLQWRTRGIQCTRCAGMYVHGTCFIIRDEVQGRRTCAAPCAIRVSISWNAIIFDGNRNNDHLTLAILVSMSTDTSTSRVLFIRSNGK